MFAQPRRSSGRGIVLTASDDRSISIRIMDSANGALLSTESEARSGRMCGIAFVSDPDGRVSGSYDDRAVERCTSYEL